MDDIDRAIAALQAVRLIRDAYASSPKGQELTREIIEALRAGGGDRSLRVHIAAAVSRWQHNEPV